MKTLVLGVAVLAALAVASTANARPLGGCGGYMCGMNGTQLTGIALPTVEAKKPVVNAVTLPSGETVDLR